MPDRDRTGTVRLTSRRAAVTPRTQRKGRESNPQGSSLARLPSGSRRQIGWPFRIVIIQWAMQGSNLRPPACHAGALDPLSEPPSSSSVHAPTRTRTRNSSLEARHDLRFTIETSQRKARDSNPHALRANRLSRAARPTVSGYLPYSRSGPAGESNPDLLVASQASSRWTSSPCSCQRSVRELNPVFRLTKAACCRNTYRPISVIPDGIEPSLSWMSAQASSPLDHGIDVSNRGGSRTHKVTRLSTSPLCQFAYPAMSSSGSGSRTRRAELMRLGWALAHPRQSGGTEPGSSL